MRRDIWLRQSPDGYQVSLHFRKATVDPFEDSQDMLRFKSGQQEKPSTKAAFAALGVAGSNIAVARHRKRIERLNDMRTKS